MKYIVISEPYKSDAIGRNIASGDMFIREFDDKEKAIDFAKYTWDSYTNSERSAYHVYVVESVNANEDAAEHFDGDYVWDSFEI